MVPSLKYRIIFVARTGRIPATIPPIKSSHAKAPGGDRRAMFATVWRCGCVLDMRAHVFAKTLVNRRDGEALCNILKCACHHLCVVPSSSIKQKRPSLQSRRHRDCPVCRPPGADARATTYALYG